MRMPLAYLLVVAMTAAITITIGKASPQLDGGDGSDRALTLSDGSQVVIAMRGDPQAEWLYINLHDDEQTSVEAADRIRERTGAFLVELRHTGRRNIRFSLGAEAFAFDPNRMFTPEGRRQTLASQSPPSSRSTREAEPIVSSFAASVLEIAKLPTRRAVVALHNNGEGGYSAASYLPGAIYANDAEAVHIGPDTDPDDFCFVTDRRVYDALVASGLNAVLQDNRNATDDGSLSVICGQTGVVYVNVEAQTGHLDEQVGMLQIVDRVLRALPSDK